MSRTRPGFCWTCILFPVSGGARDPPSPPPSASFFLYVRVLSVLLAPLAADVRPPTKVDMTKSKPVLSCSKCKASFKGMRSLHNHQVRCRANSRRGYTGGGAAVVEEAENEQNPPGMLRFAAFFAAFCTIFAAFRTIKNLCRHFQCQSPMWVLFSMLEGKPRGPKT